MIEITFIFTQPGGVFFFSLSLSLSRSCPRYCFIVPCLLPPHNRPVPQLHVPQSANGKDAVKRTAVESALEKSATTPTAYLTWKVENFPSFKEIMETRKIFSRYFNAGKCELRLGVYESYDILCIYLESDNHNTGSNIANNQNQQVGFRMFSRNFWGR